MVNNHEKPRLSFRKLGHLLKAKGIVGKHRVPLWEIALELVLYQLGLSFRKTARVLGLLGFTTVSYEDIRKVVERVLSTGIPCLKSCLKLGMVPG